MTAFEHLYQHASYLSIKNQKQREQETKAREEKKEKECTFKPQILSRRADAESKAPRGIGSETIKRSVKQYQERRRQGTDKTTEEVEYER